MPVDWKVARGVACSGAVVPVEGSVTRLAALCAAQASQASFASAWDASDGEDML